MKDLDKVRELFLTEVDDETRLDNEQKILEWETALQTNEAIAEWREHDITKMLIARARESYKDVALMLAVDRRLSTETREKLWAKQDAYLFLLSLMDIDAQAELQRIHSEIRQALNATN